MIKQIEEVLPHTRLDGVDIRESYEPLAEIEETDHVMHGSRLGPHYEGNSYFLRKTVVDMLHIASLLLPEGYQLVMIEGVRSMQKQQQLWDGKYKEISKTNSNLSPEEMKRQARLLVAEPTPLANHNCGGAVDVTIARLDRTLVDMGTMPQDIRDAKVAMMFSSLITPEQKANRTMLRKAMRKAGFVFYPGVWWHYCHDDRMYAAYTGRKSCHYGPIQLLFETK